MGSVVEREGKEYLDGMEYRSWDEYLLSLESLWDGYLSWSW